MKAWIDCRFIALTNKIWKISLFLKNLKRATIGYFKHYVLYDLLRKKEGGGGGWGGGGGFSISILLLNLNKERGGGGLLLQFLFISFIKECNGLYCEYLGICSKEVQRPH